MRKHLSAGVFLVLSVLCANVHGSVMLGAFVPGNGWKQENIFSLNDQLHKKLSFINLFSSFTEGWDQLYWQTSKVTSAGMVPMVTWMPIDQTRKEVNILPEITAGLWDDYLIEWCNRFKAWRNNYAQGSRPDILLRFGHEFNGNWYSYSDSPDAYKQAYRHIHKLFNEHGANQFIEWVWSANNLNIDTVNDITRYYPGDVFVDWTSIDGYNWGTNYSWTSWESFTEVYANTYNTLVKNYPDKPILIAEYGSTEPTDVPDSEWGQDGDDSDVNENKDIWFLNMLLTLEEDFPAIRAIGLFNINKELDWSITETENTGLTGMNLGLTSDYFVSEYIAAPDNNEPDVQDPANQDDSSNRPTEPPIAYARDSTSAESAEQLKLAHSRALPPVETEKVERARQGFLNMSAAGRAQLRELKLSVLDGQ